MAAASAALYVPTFDLSNFTVNATNTTKECLLDGIVVLIREVMIAAVTRSIVNWINSGFNGNPAFVDDLGGFLLGVGDEAAGEFLRASGLGFVCEPFRANIQFSLSVRYFSEERDVCTLTDIINNIDGFFNDFNQGGWSGWFSLTTQKTNNPYGGFLDASSKLSARIVNAKGEQIKLLDFGEGFLSFEECESVDDEGLGQEDVCHIATPGSVINEQLNFQLGSGQRQLELADEIDEIIGALFSQLVQQVLTGSGGLRATTQSRSGRPSFFQQIEAEQDTQLEVTRQRTADYVREETRGLETVEVRVREAKRDSLATAGTAIQTLGDVQACYGSKLATTTSQRLSSGDAETARSRMAAASSTVTTTLLPLQERLRASIDAAGENLRRIAAVGNETTEAIAQAGSAEQLSFIIDEFGQSVLFSPVSGLHNPGDIALAQQESRDVSGILSQARTDLNVCGSFPN